MTVVHSAFSTRILLPERTCLKTFGSAVILPKTFTGLAGRISLPLLIGVGPKKGQQGILLGEWGNTLVRIVRVGMVTSRSYSRSFWQPLDEERREEWQNAVK